MIKKILAWIVLVAMAAGIIALAVYLWDASRNAAIFLISVICGTALALLLIWALEEIGWL